MNTPELLAMRSAIRAWQERWSEKIEEDLEASTLELRRLLIAEVDALKPSEALRAKRFAAEKLQPLFADWCKKKEEDLLTAAEKDLQNQFERTVADRSTEGEIGIEIDVKKEALLHLAGTALSGAAAVATIPAIAIFSTASAKGILSLLGFGATVLVTRNIVIGLAVLIALLALTYKRFVKGISKTKARLRDQIEQQIQERIVYSKKRPSLTVILTGRIEETAKKLLGELDNAA